MANWKNNTPTKYDEYMGMSYASTEVNWEYQTVSDTLSLHYKQEPYSDFNSHPEKTWVEHMSKEKALAVMEQLMSWCNRYEGEEDLNQILTKIRTK